MYIYVIATEDAEFTKVGMAAKPWDRLKELQTGNPYKLSLELCVNIGFREGAEDIERRAHGILASKRQEGEWFNVVSSYAMHAVLKAISAYYLTTYDMELAKHKVDV